jgi:hypothetical protein
VSEGTNDGRKRVVGGRHFKSTAPRLSLAHQVMVRQQYQHTSGAHAWCARDNLSGPRVVASTA